MPLSAEIRRLKNKWDTNTGWPKRLEWIEISGLRGWSGQRIDFNFPIVAIVGENGSGKSTVIQCAASIYRPVRDEKPIFPSTFFPDTPWERVQNVTIRYSVREGTGSKIDSVRKHMNRWRGYYKRPQRHMKYIDLSRVQPVGARTGYQRLANPQFNETSFDQWEDRRVTRLSQVMAKRYEGVRMSLTDADRKRKVPVLTVETSTVSGFHQGAGETTMAELLNIEPRQTEIILIDEIETSLHPRVQRRLIRELAEQARANDLQFIITTHSPYVLEELPQEARIYIVNDSKGRKIVTGVSPEFAMTKMDEEQHPECDLYVEDDKAAALLKEIIIKYKPNLLLRCQLIAYGAASVGYVLGQMAMENRFPRPSCVFLDGDQSERPGCIVLPGDDAPERVVFGSLFRGTVSWGDLHTRIGRLFTDTVDACQRAMTIADHHQWVKYVGEHLLISSDILWHAMCGVWVNRCLERDVADRITSAIEDAIGEQPTRPSFSTEPQLPFSR
jgi:predicted ATPase